MGYCYGLYLGSDSSAIDGGFDVMWNSLLTTYACTSFTPITASTVTNCTLLMKVPENNLIQNEIVVYPNPATDYLTINFASDKSGDGTINIINIFGQEIIKQKMKMEKGKTEIKMKVDNLANGIYLCNIYFDNKRTSLKFIKQ